MQPIQFTVLLVNPDHLNWIGLRAALHERPDVAVVGDVRQVGPAVQAARVHHPDALFVAADLPGTSIVALVRELRAASPGSKIVLIGEAKTLRRDTLRALGELKISGYVLWEDFTEEALPACLSLVLKTNLLVGSRAVLEEFLALLDSPSRPRDTTLALSDDERAVLKRLAEGLTQRQIAQAEHMSERKVRRVIAALEEKFAAPSPFVLGMRALSYGIIA